ncbi:hypothetical protein O6H91_20G067100 [Diphasiastrum complanatum]|uniref:Uncharacterized protein n=1 Tax=Diphasiastrum complanatum TaxID=34168 RepID=A0ACC2ARH6_DIPCM|nr:hypothetical protein O6H91_20G067100 [Diphasiastrum complanatum]
MSQSNSGFLLHTVICDVNLSLACFNPPSHLHLYLYVCSCICKDCVTYMSLMQSLAQHSGFFCLPSPSSSSSSLSHTTSQFSDLCVVRFNNQQLFLSPPLCLQLQSSRIRSLSLLKEPQTNGLEVVVKKDQQALIKRIAAEEGGKVDGARSTEAAVRALTWALRDAEDGAELESLLADMEFPLPVYSSVIQKLGKEGRYKAANYLFRWLQTKIDAKERANVYIYTSLLGAFKASGCVEMANLLVKEMTEMGVALNLVTYNTIISLYKQQGRFEEALGIFDEVQKLGLQPSFVTYSYVFQIFKKTANFDDALDLYQKIKVLSNVKIGLLQSSMKVDDFYITLNNLENLERWVVQAGLQRIMNGLASQSNRRKLVVVFQKMKGAQLKISRLDCRMLILHCGRSEEDYFLLKALFHFMQERDLFLEVYLCNHIIRAFGEGYKFWAALEVFEHMLMKGPIPSTVTYKILRSQFHVLLSAASRRKIWKWALQLIDKMIDKGIEPDTYAWNITLAACAKAGKATAAVEAFQKMIERGAMPDVYSYGALLSALEKESLEEKAEQVWNSMHKVMVMPNDAAYTTMISLYGKIGKYGKVMDMFHEMQKSGIQPSLITYNALITACALAGDGEGALGWLETMNANKIEPDSTTYQQLIEALANANDWKRAAAMYVEMQKLQLQPSHSTYDLVLKTCKANDAHIEIGLLGPRPHEEKRRNTVDASFVSMEQLSSDIRPPACTSVV